MRKYYQKKKKSNCSKCNVYPENNTLFYKYGICSSISICTSAGIVHAIPCLSRQQLITTSNLIKIIHYLQVALLPPSSFAVNVSVAVGWYTSFFMTPIQEGINLLLWLFYANCFLYLLMKTKTQGLVICSIYWLWVDFLPNKVIFHTKCIYIFIDYITFYRT